MLAPNQSSFHNRSIEVNWKARMPRQMPDEGKVHIVFAVKKANRYRVEYTGQISEDKALKIYSSLWKDEPQK